jgi:hypothetical protein
VDDSESDFDSGDGHDRFFVLQNDQKDYGIEKGLPGVKLIKNAWNYISTPPGISMTQCHIKHRDSSCSIELSTVHDMCP